MSACFETLLSNAVAATLLAFGVGLAALLRLRPAVRHALWLIVLVKFITPPLFPIEWRAAWVWSNRPSPARGDVESSTQHSAPNNDPVHRSVIGITERISIESDFSHPH